MTQSILSSMDSDDVNSINDTEESLQVAQIIEDTYFEMMSQKDWPHLKLMMELESVSDSTRPNFLRIPDQVSEIRTIKYDATEPAETNSSIINIRYLHPEEFLSLTHTRTTSATNVITVTTTDGIPMFIFDDKEPIWWTSFDDELIIFDAYVKTTETTLQGSKSIVFAVKTPIFTQSDTFTPDLPEKMFPLLLAEAKRAAHLYLKQQDSPMDAKRALRGRNRMKVEGWRAHDPRKTTNFGRRGLHRLGTSSRW